jgi:hypothetical protein
MRFYPLTHSFSLNLSVFYWLNLAMLLMLLLLRVQEEQQLNYLEVNRMFRSTLKRVVVLDQDGGKNIA